MEVDQVSMRPMGARNAAGQSDNGDEGQLRPQAARRAQRSDFERIVSELWPEARAIRQNSNLGQTLSFVLAATVIGALTLLYTTAAGIMQIAGYEDVLTPKLRVSLLFFASIFFLFGMTIIWVVFIFFDGWWRYDPRDAKSGRRGATRDWYDAMQDSLTEQEVVLTPGIVRGFRLNLETKTRSAHMKMWALLLLLSSASFLAVSWSNYFSKEFVEAVGQLVTDGWQAVRWALALLINTPIAQAAEVPAWLSLILYATPGVLGVAGALNMYRKSEIMSWSLLSTPDILRRFLYYYRHKQNKAANYTDEMAQDEAFYWLLNKGIEAAPENFFSSDGRLFFFDSAITDEVYEDYGSATRGVAKRKRRWRR